MIPIISILVLLFMTFGRSFSVRSHSSREANLVSTAQLLTEEERISLVNDRLSSLLLSSSSDGLPVFDECYRNSMTELMEGCKSLSSDDERTRFALRLTNCNLRKVGLRVYKCSRRDNVEKCLAPITKDIRAFNTFTTLNSHVDNLCFFLSADQFSDKVDESVRVILDIMNIFSRDLSGLVESEKKMISMIEKIENTEEKVLGLQRHVKNAVEDHELAEHDRFKSLNTDLDSLDSKTSNIGTEIISLRKKAAEVIDRMNALNNQLVQKFDSMEKKVGKMDSSLKATIDHSQLILSNTKDIKGATSDLKKDHGQLKHSAQDISKMQKNVVAGQNNLVKSQSSLKAEIDSSMKSLKSDTKQLKTTISKSADQMKKLSDEQKVQLHLVKDIGRDINVQMAITKDGIQDVLDSSQRMESEFRDSMKELMNSTSGFVGDIKKLFGTYNSLLGEWMSFSCIFYYLCSCFVIYLLTSTKSTQRVRILVYLITAVGFFLEKRTVMKHAGVYDNEYIDGKIKWMRKILVLVCLGVICYSYKTYKNYENLNHSLLQKIWDREKTFPEKKSTLRNRNRKSRTRGRIRRTVLRQTGSKKRDLVRRYMKRVQRKRKTSLVYGRHHKGARRSLDLTPDKV